MTDLGGSLQYRGQLALGGAPVAELPDRLLHAESIARASADALNDPNAVAPEEEIALGEIARLLE